MESSYMNDPLVSIIITTCNRSDILSRAILSAINQTYKNIEIIVVDDGSDDNTDFIINNFIENFHNIIYLKHDKSLGANVARNNGIKNANGVFIAGLDDDDEFFPQRIELLLKNYSDKYAFVTSDDIIMQEQSYKQTNKPKIITLKSLLKENLVGNQVLVKRERLVFLNGFDEKLIASQDYDMWLRLVNQYGSAFVIKQGLQKIYISKTIQRISTNKSRKFRGYFAFYKKHKILFDIEARKMQLARLYKTRAKRMSFKTFKSLFSFYSFKYFIRNLAGMQFYE